MSDEEKKKNTSLITNPAIVKSAINASKKSAAKTPNGSPQKNQRPKSTSTTKDALSATSNANDNMNGNANGKKKEKKQNSVRPKSEGADKRSDKKKDDLKKPKSAPHQKKTSPPATPRKKPERSMTDPDTSNDGQAGEDLKSILFPDLYGKKNGQAKPRSVNNSTPKRGPPAPPTFDNTPNGSRFAGSSFSSSSPAPSALPKPSFKLKSAGDEPSSLSQTPPSSSGSLFDQFMMADRQERQARATTVINAPVMNQQQQVPQPPIPSAAANNNNSMPHPQQPHLMYAQYQPALHPPHSSSQSPVSY